MVTFMSPRSLFRLATEPPTAEMRRSAALGGGPSTLVMSVTIALLPALPLPALLGIGYGYLRRAGAAHSRAAA